MSKKAYYDFDEEMQDKHPTLSWVLPVIAYTVMIMSIAFTCYKAWCHHG